MRLAAGKKRCGGERPRVRPTDEVVFRSAMLFWAVRVDWMSSVGDVTPTYSVMAYGPG